VPDLPIDYQSSTLPPVEQMDKPTDAFLDVPTPDTETDVTLLDLFPNYAEKDEVAEKTKIRLRHVFSNIRDRSDLEDIWDKNDEMFRCKPDASKDSTHRANEAKLQEEQAASAIKDNIAKLTSKDSPSIGPDDADVTIVEFFDYNCGYCKRALPDVQAIAASDKKVRFVFKEMPILGPTSGTAAQWALAAKRQDKYFEYHTALMEFKGQKEEKQLAKIAKDLGLDVEKMKKDASSDEVQAEIDADVELARTIGINGTPAFIVEETLYPGYIGEDGMVQAIKEAREQQ